MGSEGIDDDGDGQRNEDGIGGLDLNRNFPRNWEPQHLQPGAGDFPLSEPETYAAVRFIHDHPNITGIVHGHTSGGFVYRLPSASAPMSCAISPIRATAAFKTPSSRFGSRGHQSSEQPKQ